MSTFSWPIRIYYDDTDATGLVYHAQYLCFFERARTEWLRSVGIDQPQIRDQQGVVFVIRHVELDFLLPAKFNDELLVVSEIAKWGRASLDFAQSIYRDDGEQRTELCRAKVRVVSVSAEDYKPCLVPDALQALKNSK